MESDWWHRWMDRPGRTASGSSSATLVPSTGVWESRTEVCPPSLQRRGRALSGLRDWLVSGGIGATADLGTSPDKAVSADTQRLEVARRAFVDALGDIDDAAAERLRGQIRLARTLRELWHLRLEVFQSVSLALGQVHAQQRLDRLSTFFDTRAKRLPPKPLQSCARTSSW